MLTALVIKITNIYAMIIRYGNLNKFVIIYNTFVNIVDIVILKATTHVYFERMN